jgi:putative transposase
MDILTFFACFGTLASSTSIGQMAVIANAMLTMTGQITMLSLSRWTGEGGSYRTILRFFATKLAWQALQVKFFQTHTFNPADEYILVGDETIVSKSGTQTFGLGRFYSGLQKRVIKGLSFFVFSLCNVNESESSPVAIKQIVREKSEKVTPTKQKKKQRKTKRGRKPGSPNKDKMELDLSPELLRINEILLGLMKLLKDFIKVKYLAMDGHFGHNQAVLMAMEQDLYLISKLRKDVALFEKYEGKYSGTGKPKKYGKRVRIELMSAKYLKESEVEGDLTTNYYQGIFLHKEFGMPLNVVVIVQINVKTRKMGHAVLFSNDVELGWEKLVKYYRLRFQIEFNFRDAKQHFGLEDFMNQTQIGVENASNLAFLMLNVSAKLLKEKERNCVGINDLKSQYRGIYYALETLKLVEPKAASNLIEKVKQVISRIGSIHRHNFSSPAA